MFHQPDSGQYLTYLTYFSPQSLWTWTFWTCWCFISQKVGQTYFDLYISVHRVVEFELSKNTHWLIWYFFSQTVSIDCLNKWTWTSEGHNEYLWKVQVQRLFGEKCVK